MDKILQTYVPFGFNIKLNQPVLNQNLVVQVFAWFQD